MTMMSKWTAANIRRKCVDTLDVLRTTQPCQTNPEITELWRTHLTEAHSTGMRAHRDTMSGQAIELAIRYIHTAANLLSGHEENSKDLAYPRQSA